MTNIHATCVSLDEKGILLLGKSGCGKTDLALRLIEQIGAILVADDRTVLEKKGKEVYASCPDKIKGLMEIRGLGLVKQQTTDKAKIKLVVNLVDAPQNVDRMPKKTFFEYDGIKIKQVNLYAFEESAVYKIRLACDENRLVS